MNYFIVIGVHTPEFEFEKKQENVEQAIKQYNIHYPVPQDNDYVIWNAYSNQYWPAEYLIDVNGNIRRTHFGEGEYDQSEMAIQELLKEAGSSIDKNILDMKDETPKARISSETYLGSKRMEFLYPNGNVGNGNQVFKVPKDLPSNSFSFGGEWNIKDEESIVGKNAVIEYNFMANKVFLVLRPPSVKQNAKVKVFIDGKLADISNSGKDVADGVMTIDSDRLYNLVDLHGDVGSHLLRLEFQTEGISAFAFTFG